MAFEPRTPAVLLAFLATAACRGSSTGNAAADVGATVNLNGTSGCSTPAPAFGASSVAFTPASLAPYVPSPTSALCARASDAIAYIAIPGPAPGPAVLRLDLDTGTSTEFATPAAFAAFDPDVSKLSGIAILNGNTQTPGTPDTLLVVDGSTNRILALSSLTITPFAGIASTLGGFADGDVGGCLFRFNAPTQIAVGGDGTVYVPDPGNARIRQISFGAVSTIAGSGAPGYLDGNGFTARFDLPNSVAIECNGSLLVTEGSNHVRRIRFTESTSFGGGVIITVSTVAGDGTAASTDGPLGKTGASVFDPVAINVGTRPDPKKQGTIFWLDRGSGIVRQAIDGTGDVESAYAGAPVVAANSSFGLCGTFDGSALLVDSANSQILRLP